MTVRTTLSFTERHHRFLQRKVEQGVFASLSAAVASAVETTIEEETAREAALAAMAAEIRARLATPAGEHLPLEAVLDEVRARLAGRGAAGPETWGLPPPYEVRLHPAVRDDLARIAEGLADYAGPEVAERRLAAFAEAPHKGTIRDEIAPGLRAIPAAGRTRRRG